MTKDEEQPRCRCRRAMRPTPNNPDFHYCTSCDPHLVDTIPRSTPTA